MYNYDKAPARKVIHINDIDIHEMPTDYLKECRERTIEAMKALNGARKYLDEAYDEKRGIAEEAYRIGWEAGKGLVSKAYQDCSYECECIDQEIHDRETGRRDPYKVDAMFGWDRPRWDADIPVKSL